MTLADSVRTVAAALAFVGCAGCWGWFGGTGGVVSSTTLASNRIGGAGQVDAAVGPAGFPVAFQIFADGKGTARGGDGGLGVGTVVWPELHPVSPMLSAGVHL